MDLPFWTKAWNDGRTAFHQADFNGKLLQHFPALAPKPGQRVLVPLCGKTKDLLWLSGLGLQVHGVEWHEEAVQAFFAENALPPPQKTQEQDFTHYNAGPITLSSGDFFKLDEDGAYDLVYDRAALVALPASMRQAYADVIKRSLKKGGACLLVVYDYDQAKMEGPPFSVKAEEVQALYGDQCTVTLLESGKPTNEGPRLDAVEGLAQKIYSLKKTS